MSWRHAVIDAYEPLEDVTGWERCPRCGEHPRVWQFDNGSHASCKCGERYRPSLARAESILSFVRRNNGSCLGYPDNELRDRWNEYARTGEPQNELPEGRW